MNTTQYYSLGKPLSTEKYSVSVQNTNMDLIDSALNRIELKNSNQDNALSEHAENSNNPHNVTKAQLGLGNVDNKSSATIRSEITRDNVVNALGYTPYTPNEVDNKFSALESAIDWKEAVETYDDIAITYPEPEDGWTVNVNDTDYTYRYNGEEWIAISANAIPKATASVDGLLSKEDYVNYEDAYSKKHTHDNKDIIDSITQDMIDKWNEGSENNNNGITNSNPSMYVVGTEHCLYYSDDDLFTITEIQDCGRYFKVILYVKEQNKFVAMKNEGICYSTDGKSWENVDINSFAYGQLMDIAYGDGVFVCVTNTGKILYSTDITTWNNASGHNTGTSIIYTSVTYGNSKFVAVSDNGMSYCSTNGETWNEMNGLNTEQSYRDVIYGNGKFVCISGSTCAYSLDGITWNMSELNQTMYSITYGDGQFVISGNNKVYYSDNGITWNEINSTSTFFNVEYVNDNFVGFDIYGNLYYSSNGEMWAFNKCISGVTCLAYSPGQSSNLTDYVTKTELRKYAQPIIGGNGLSKITYSTTEPETIEDGEIVFVYEE